MFSPKSSVCREWSGLGGKLTSQVNYRPEAKRSQAFSRELRSTLEWGPRVQGGPFKEPSGEE